MSKCSFWSKITKKIKAPQGTEKVEIKINVTQFYSCMINTDIDCTGLFGSQEKTKTII